MKQTAILLLIAVVGMIAPLSYADDGKPIKVNMVVQEEVIVTNKDGEKTTKLIAPASVIPGDTVVYTTYVKNTGKTSADEVTINNPIPAEITYFEGSATQENASVTFSIDGGKSYALPENLVVVEEDGKERPATHKDYTHIQWVLNTIKPGEQIQVSFHGKLK